jgi:putative DNA primase/helicase
MIPVDLDGIDMNKIEEYIRVTIDFLKVDKNKTGIFNSGHGLHFVIILDAPIASVKDLEALQPYYTELCKQLEEKFYSLGLSGKADPVRFCESATLRLPLTTNKKRDKQNNPLPDVLATVIQGTVEPQAFYMDRLVTPPTPQEKLSMSGYNVDVPAVLGGCEFLKHCYSNQGTVSEPEWYAMMGTLAFIPDIGRELCHTYSEKHSGYDRDVTDQKIDQAMGFGRPRLCSSIHEVFSGCVNCKHYMKCKTPLQIRSEDFIATEKTGFHEVLFDANGNPSKFIPNYSDLVKYFAREHQYCVDKKTRMIYVFNGTHWEERTELEIDNFSTTQFKPTANNTKRSEFRGLLYSTNVVNDDFFYGKTDGFINFNNGILHIASRTLRPHSPEMGFKYVLPYDYNPNATCPNFVKFLDGITKGDQELSQIILEYMAYAISGIDPHWGQKALIMVGSGSNGKSTLIQAMQDLVGPMSYTTVSLTHMANENMRETLVNKLFNISEEEKYDALRDSSEFKNIVTGGNTMVKRMYHQPYTTKIMAKLIIGCNEIPPTNDHSDGTYRRLLIIPLKAKFSEEEGNLDLDMKAKIKMEMSGIYNLILDGYNRLISNRKFTASKASTLELERYRNDNDFIHMFFTECMDDTNKVEDFVTFEEILSEYSEWRRLNGVKSEYTSIALSKRIRMILKNRESTQRKVGALNKRGLEGLKFKNKMTMKM